MNPEKVIAVASVALYPLMMGTEIVNNTKETVTRKYESVKSELRNRRNFDKKHGYTRSSKRKESK